MTGEYIDLDLDDFLDEDTNDSIIISDIIHSSNYISNTSLDIQQPTLDHLQTLKSQFGHSAFKPLQWTVINTILNSRHTSNIVDQCIVLATGFGKSLCYQFIPVYTQSLALVISPLISLMQDQVHLMEMRGISAVFLGSAQQNSSLALDRVFNNECRLLYISPEYCMRVGADFISNLAKKVEISVVAIDEAHCVSSWGHDFRKDYGDLSELRNWLPNVPFLALTATASKLVREDIIQKLALRNPITRTSSLNRPNLYFEIYPKSKEIEADMKLLLHNENPSSLLRKCTFNGSCIVYCISRNATEEVSGVLSSLGVKCEYYHAGLTPKKREEVHNRFVRDEIECIVATIAFGMGIDKPDIRTVIHYGAPKEMESYMQEVGRAGRDGMSSRCVVFYSGKDFVILQRIVLDGLDWNNALKEHRSAMMQKMEIFVRSQLCRRQQLLQHFDEIYSPNEDDPTIRCCDVCTSRQLDKKRGLDKLSLNTKSDFTEEAKLLLESISFRDGKSGVGQHALFLTGSSQTFDFLKPHRLFGTGKKRNQKWWMAFGKLMQYEGYLNLKPVRHGYGSTISLSDKSRQFLSNIQTGQFDSVKLTPLPEMNKAAGISCLSYTTSQRPVPVKRTSHKVVEKNTNVTYQGSLLLPHISRQSSYELVTMSGASSQEELTPEQEQIQENLYLHLLTVRSHVANKLDCASYMICSNKVAMNLASIRPSSIENLKKIEGISDLFSDKYGQDFLQEIREFCNKHSEMKMDNFIDECEQVDRSPLKKRTVAKPNLDALALTIYEKYSMDKLDIEDICKHYSLSQDIVYSNLNLALDAGYLVDYRQLGLDEGTEKLILDVLRAPPFNSDLSNAGKIKEQLNHLPEWKVDMALTLIRITYGVDNILPPQGVGITSSLADNDPTVPPLIRASSSHSQSSLERSFSENSKSLINRTRTQDSGQAPRPKKRKLPAWL